MKILLSAAFFCAGLSVSTASYGETLAEDGFRLEKAVIFSRHGLRAPLTESGSELAKITPYPWSKAPVPAGYLTPKGTILEVKFGQYLKSYFEQNGLLAPTQCLPKEGVLVYANSLQRTIATGQALIAGLFPGCDAPLRIIGPVGKMDPVFNPVVRTDNPQFKQTALEIIPLQKTNLELQKNYQLLSEIIDYPHSELCLKEQKCDFTAEQGTLRIAKDKEPRVSGTLRTSKKIVDALLLAYYEGSEAENIVGGNLDSDQKWRQINEIKNRYLTMLRGEPFIARHISLPLIKFIADDLKSGHKITVLIGHDSNIVALLSALDVQSYQLSGQYENTPIGGKLLFEVWQNPETKKKKVTLSYIYQSTEQIRHNEDLSLNMPPQRQILKISECKTETDDGSCDYDAFIEKLADIITQTE